MIHMGHTTHDTRVSKQCDVWATRHMTHVRRMTRDLSVCPSRSGMTLRLTLLYMHLGGFPFRGVFTHCVDGSHFVTTHLSGTHGSSCLLSVVGVLSAGTLGVWASESLLSVPWGGDPEVGLPKRIVILC